MALNSIIKLVSSYSLAPMAGVTDLPFRNVVSKFGVDMVFSEMIADNSLVSRVVKNQKIELGTSFSNTAVQLAGCEPVTMGEAAKIVSDLGAGAIDINMGCPAKKSRWRLFWLGPYARFEKKLQRF